LSNCYLVAISNSNDKFAFANNSIVSMQLITSTNLVVCKNFLQLLFTSSVKEFAILLVVAVGSNLIGVVNVITELLTAMQIENNAIQALT